MIRGPVLPQLRDSLWSLVSSRLDCIETGLTLVLESLDCSDGELGPAEGLARDAAGGVVLVMLAVEGDALLSARALSAGRFLARVNDSFALAVPEGNFCPGTPGRILLIGTEPAATAFGEVCALPIPGLHACTLEPFRIAGRERFAVRWIATPQDSAWSLDVAMHASDGIEATEVEPTEAATSPAEVATRALPQPEFVVPPARARLWEAALSICERIDNAVIVHGDRFSRTISWNGNVLGDVRTVGGDLVASSATGVVRDLRDLRDVRRFGDQLLRAFVHCAQLDIGNDRDSDQQPNSVRTAASSTSGAVMAGNDRTAATRHAVGDRREPTSGETLRASLAESKLTPEEYSALGEPASVAGPIIEGSLAKDRS